MSSGADEILENRIRQEMRRALEHMRAGRTNEAAALYRRVLKVQRDHPDALYLMGVIAFKLGKVDVATNLMSRSVTADPSNAGYQVNLGNVYLKLQQFDKAIDCYRGAIAHDPNYAAAYAYLGNALSRLGDAVGSENALRHAVELRQQQNRPVPPQLIAALSMAAPVVQDAGPKPRDDAEAPAEKPGVAEAISAAQFLRMPFVEAAIEDAPIADEPTANASFEETTILEARSAEESNENAPPGETPSASTFVATQDLQEAMPADPITEEPTDVERVTNNQKGFIDWNGSPRPEPAPHSMEGSMLDLPEPDDIDQSTSSMTIATALELVSATPALTQPSAALEAIPEPVLVSLPADALDEHPLPLDDGMAALPPQAAEVRGLAGLLGEAHSELMGESFDSADETGVDAMEEDAVWLSTAHATFDDIDASDREGIGPGELGSEEPPSVDVPATTRVRPPSAESLRRRALECMNHRRHAEAIELLNRAVQLRPNFAAAHRDLGGALLRQGDRSAAIASLKRALELKPSFATAWGSLGDAYQLEGKISKAIRCYRRLLKIHPTAAKVHSNLLLSINYDKRTTPVAVYEEHIRWARHHADPLSRHIKPHENDHTRNRKIRIAYLSPDFRRHSVNYFIEPVLSSHDREQFHVTCYSDVIRPDAVTASLSNCVDNFVDVKKQSDHELAERVRHDQIDILVDLAGHTGNNRMGVFARKPAPVQVTYLGYPNTTGLSTIDYRITDAKADPPGRSDELHTERLLRMPDCFLCYRPPMECPEVSTAPCLTNEHVTFGCFNVLAKVTSDVLALWARILVAIPRSRLVLKGRSGAYGHERRRQYVRDAFVYYGVAADRIDMLPIEPTFAGHLALYSTIDIALDPFPYNGTTTTCEALWMGLPVVSLAGDRHVARVGQSILTATDLSDLIAWSTDGYVRMAAWLARDTQRLARIRAGLRGKLLQSPLCNPTRFTQSLEFHYRSIWEHWCDTGGVHEVQETLTLHDD